MVASNLPRFANYMGLSLCIRYQFDMIHDVSRNRLDDAWFLSVSIQEGIKPPVSFCLHWMISLWHLFITQHVVTHAVSIPIKEPTMLIRFYCIVIRSSRMLYMIGIKEISFFIISDLPRFANYMGLSFRMQYQFDNPTYRTYSVFGSHSRAVKRNPTPNGAAVLLTFDSIEELKQYLLRLYPNKLFH